MKKRTLKQVTERPPELGREQQAQFVKERIYGSVTLIAVNFGLLLKPNITTDTAVITILATTIGIWLASLFAAITAYRIVHDKNIPRKEFWHEIIIHRGLLLAAVPSVIMLTLAGIGVIDITTAIILDICLALVALIVTISRAAKTKSNSHQTALISVAIQAMVAIATIGIVYVSK